jgi:hypothetical protein
MEVEMKEIVVFFIGFLVLISIFIELIKLPKSETTIILIKIIALSFFGSLICFLFFSLRRQRAKETTPQKKIDKGVGQTPSMANILKSNIPDQPKLTGNNDENQVELRTRPPQMCLTSGKINIYREKNM